MRIPNQLLEAVRDRRAVLFAGAGISVKALGLLARDIRNAIGEVIRQDFPGYDYSLRSVEDVCDEYVALNDKISLVNKLAELFPPQAAPLPSHVTAVELFRFICTTNWDTLFEAAYRQVGQGFVRQALRCGRHGLSYLAVASTMFSTVSSGYAL